jgi:hypothetical protein
VSVIGCNDVENDNAWGDAILTPPHMFMLLVTPPPPPHSHALTSFFQFCSHKKRYVVAGIDYSGSSTLKSNKAFSLSVNNIESNSQTWTSLATMPYACHHTAHGVHNGRM